MFSVSPAYSKVRGGRHRVGGNMAAVRFGVLPGEHDEAREEGHRSRCEQGWAPLTGSGI